eukprot:CAMPEP_0119504032 /NCGR_PEP_ID=MMETSP1344-20130328/25009_1 /TAXON_ID=236787 /ORGANISM="Florenciella parvula, Strain CCMP2471" /LENGTH=228 /DNA_ID=CAMNT_0007540369 /DNA_START=90 /DNA_END=776 /DNA_ORIENTATION=-
MMHCNHNDVDEITFLWHSIIMRELPLANTEEGQAHLMGLAQRWGVSGPQQSGTFEDGQTWQNRLAMKLIGVGEEVFQSNSKYVFPVRLLSLELEMITGTLSHTTQYRNPRDLWVADALFKAGVPYDELFNNYSGLVNVAGQNWPVEHQLQILMSFTRLLKDWVNHTKNMADPTQLRIFRLQCSQGQIVTAHNALLGLHPNEPGAKDMVARTKSDLNEAERMAAEVWGM